MRKKRRKKKYGLRIALFILAAVMVGAVLYLYPAWKAAKVLQDRMGRPYSSFEIEVELDRERVPAEQEEMFATLARLTGLREEAMYRLSIKGSALEDKVHLMIYPEGEKEPLLEFYLSNDKNVINETMLYNAIRSNLVGQFGLLEYLMPGQEGTMYMTLEQVEQLFGVKISGLDSFRLSGADGGITAKGYFLMLAVMSREKLADGSRFALETGQIELGFDIAEEENGAARMRLWIKNPSEVLTQGDRVLSLLGNWLSPGLPSGLSREELQGLKGFSMTLTRSEEGALTIPTNLVNQETVEILSKIRAWIQETFG